MAGGLLKIKGTQLCYTNYYRIAHLLAGELIGGSFNGNLKVKGTYLHYMDNDGGQRRLLGTLTGITGEAGRLKIKGSYIRYIDNNGDERYIPTGHIFYSDAHPEETSVDGMAGRGISYPGEFWPLLHGGAPTFATDWSQYIDIQIYSSSTLNQWIRLYRILMLFDTSTIPEGSTILSAKLAVRVYYRRQVADWPLFSMVVVKSFPDSNTSLVAADYHHLGSTILSNVILVSEDPTDSWYIFTLNTTGKNAIIPAGITKLGLRDFHYDCLNTPPPWVSGSQARIQFTSADTAFPLRRPYLEVTYE